MNHYFDIKPPEEKSKPEEENKKEEKFTQKVGERKRIKNKIILFFLLFFVFVFGVCSFYFLKSEIKKPLNPADRTSKVIEIKQGEGAKEIAKKLEKNGIIKNKYYFLLYILKTNTRSQLKAGKYEFSPSMSIPVIVQKLISGDTYKEEVKITIPEGFRIDQIEERFKNSLKREKISITNFKIKDFKERYSFLADAPEDFNLEGYLFPDSYIFENKQEMSDEEVTKKAVLKMLDNFDKKLDKNLREEIKKQNKTIFEIIILASIVEKEVNKKEDREMVAGIFWKRLKEGKPLESCATIAYILKKDKWRYSYEETRIESPYNTYLNKGLPRGPISNPGLEAIKAVIFPRESEYNYFLTDPKTGKTIFAKTIEEHLQNQQKYFSVQP